MQIVSILESTLFIKRGRKFKLLVLVVGAKFWLVLNQLRNVASYEFRKRIAALFLSEFLLNVLKTRFFYCSYELVKLLKQRLIHYQQLQIIMIAKIIVASLIFVCSSPLCKISNSVNLSQQYKQYISARPIPPQQEPNITKLYLRLTNISDYEVNIDSNISIYFNNYPLCEKSGINPTFNALFDIWLCLDDYYLLKCNKNWSLLIKCGTFLQIHKPFDPTIQMQFGVQDLFWVKDSNSQSVANVLLSNVCAGTYHIWFVYYSRQGKFIKRVKTIYLSYPSCVC